jgi:hypothetical protein
VCNSATVCIRPDLTFAAIGKGIRVKGGPVGTFWSARNNAAGNYTLRATFNLTEPSSHTNYYGLVLGAAQLERDVARAPHQAVKRPDANGRSSNTLEVRVAGNMVSYVVNGTVVHSVAKNAVTTDGIAVFRVNHQLDVAVEGFELQRS